MKFSKIKRWWSYYKDIVYCSLILMGCIAIGYILGALPYWTAKPVEDNVIVITEEVPDFWNLPPEEGLWEAMEYYDIDHPATVYAQAILETGYFKSRVCKEYNNLFGLYNSRKGDYFRYNHWVESVIAYAELIQGSKRYDDIYYDYLTKIGYAEDKDYITKLKQIRDEFRNQGRYSARDTVP